MSSLYRTHLKKELRENRSLLLGLLVIVICTCASIAVLMEYTARSAHYVPSIGALCAVTLIVFTLGPESLGREAAKNRPTVLGRLPGGLLAPFFARVTLYLVTLVVGAALAYALTFTLLHLFVSRPIEIAPLPESALLFGVAGLVALLALVPACWLKQTMLGAPAGAILGASLIGAWLVMPVSLVALNAFFAEQAKSIIAIVVGAALFSAWRGFRALHTHGGGRAAAAFHGVLAFFLMSSPVVAYAGYRTYDWRYFPSEGRGLRIESVVPAADGRLLFANMSRGNGYSDAEPQWVVKIDLDRRSIEPVAPQAMITSLDVSRPKSNLDRWWLLVSNVTDVDEWSLIDTATGEIQPDESDVLSGPPSARLRAALRDNAQLTVNGMRSWLERRIWMVDSAEGPKVLREFGRSDWPRVTDNGLIVQHDRVGGKRSFVFPDSQVAVPLDRDELVTAVFNDQKVLIRQRSRGDHLLRDGTGSSVKLDLLSRRDEVVFQIDECRLLVEIDLGRRASSPLFIVDLATGTRRTPKFENGSPVMAWFMTFIGMSRTSEGRRLPVVYYLNDDGYRVARIDPVTETFERADFDIGSDGREIDGDGVVFWNAHAQTIGRVEFGSDRCEILFPFPTD